MKELKSQLSKVLIVILIVMNYILSCFPESRTIINIITCLIIILYTILYFFENKLKYNFIILLMLTLIIILIPYDISKVSILIYILLLSLRNDFCSYNSAKTMFFSSVSCLIIVMLSYFLFGFNKGYDTKIYRPLLNVVVNRMSLGFTHPNQFMINLFTLIIFYYCAYKPKLLNIVIWLFITFLFFELTQSRTVSYLLFGILSFLLLSFLASKLKIFKAFFYYNYNKPLAILLVAFCVCGILLPYFFHDSFLDVLFSGRLKISYNLIISHFTILGSNQLENLVVDNSYVYLLIVRGIPFFMLYTFFSLNSILKSKISILSFVFYIAIFALGFMEIIIFKYSVMLAILLLLQPKIITNKNEVK